MGQAIEFHGVRKRFGAVEAVAGLDVRVGAGETVALLGRNGAGKSTTISLLLGLDRADEGEVRVFGGSPDDAVRAGRAGAMLQTGTPLPRTTVRELVGFVGATYPRPLGTREALELAGMEELAGRRVDRLSGGQAQRLRFALAVAGGPELLVLDEPTAALDVEARRAFWRSMRGYAARGNTVLFSTHYLEEADGNADRIVVLDQGRVIADGTGAAIKAQVSATLVGFDLAGGSTEGLRALPGVTSLEIRGDRAVLRSGDSDATVLALAAAGRVRGLTVTPASLEDAFLTLTGEHGAPSPHQSATPYEEAVR
jgi:ABC-2 type transport system ATP-binding protein